MQSVNKEELKNIAFVFLKEQPLGVISTVTKDNTPESSSVNYFIDNDWNIYILTDKESRKVENLRQNSNAAFVVGTTLVAHTAQIQGTVEIIEESNSNFQAYIQKLKDSTKLDRDPLYNVFGNNYVVLKFTINWLRWLFFDQMSGDPIYTILIP